MLKIVSVKFKGFTSDVPVAEEVYDEIYARGVRDSAALLHPCNTCCECDTGYFLDKCMGENCNLTWDEIHSKLDRLISGSGET